MILWKLKIQYMVTNKSTYQLYILTPEKFIFSNNIQLPPFPNPVSYSNPIKKCSSPVDMKAKQLVYSPTD